MAEPGRQLLLSRVEQSEQALLARISGLDDDEMAADSALPGWTRGHVLTHLARNAETFADVLDGARRGEVLAMYGGSVVARNAGIETGASRPAPELVDDVQRTSSRLREGLRALAEPDWERHIRHVRGGGLLGIEDVVWMRWQEVEIHQVDLDRGYGPADWPAEFVELNLPRQLRRLPERAPDVSPPKLAAHDVLAWLYGRGRPGLPDLPPWP
ncbi:MAG: maleylpyruvate isomerase family mycothiol-dependent enzyme [Geodermatophilaceae bacterium]|nr:maleylpyruvate isomerase family mycothiol-dependent enzyme [Geodermatophilaceae bacterium]MDQ3465987.1 maleylpyruvate isomerase family mycothiol-dependent enzyme [Actinomycetota bacterium]